MPARASRRALTRVLACGAAWSLSFVLAQAAPPTPSVRPMYFEHLTMRDGLSQSTVMSVLQDSQGFLWLATESGLDRYDGNSVREYRRERGNERALASDYIWKIAEDSHGDLWLATVGGGVARWDRRADRFQQFKHDPADPASLAGNDVRTLFIDAQGRVWVGTDQQGLDVLDPQSGRARHYRHRADDPRSLAADAVFAIYADRAGRIWVGTDNGLSRYEPATDDFISVDAPGSGIQLGDRRIRSLLEDHTGALWIGTLSGGVTRLDPQTGRVTVFRHDADKAGSLSADRVLALLEDDAQRLWLATSGGLNLFDRRRETFVRYGRDADNPHSLRDDDIMSLYQDRAGVLWVGTRSGGVSRWNPNSWALGHYSSELTRNAAVNAFADDGADRVWVGTSDGLIEIDASGERRLSRASPPPLQLTDDRVMALLYGRDDALWIGTMAGGLARFDRNNGAVRHYRFSPEDPGTLPANGVMSLYEDRDGDVWVGTFGGGLARIERASGRLVRYPHGDRGNVLSSPRASAIAEDVHGNLWIGTVGGGLNLLERRTGRFHHYRRNDTDTSSLSDDNIYALHADRDGTLWVGTAGGGLDRVIGSSARPGEIRFENDSSLTDLPSQVVYGIESDGENRLWLSTNNGLVRMDPRSGESRLFGEAHGLQAGEFNFNAHHRSRDGTLYFGGNNGFNAFMPGAAVPNAVAPRVALTSVTILDRTLAMQELPGESRPLDLAYDDKLVTFEFAALDFASPQNNRYLYRLEGFDTDWVDAKGLPRATYTNLAAGEYAFKVRAANADGVWSEQPLSIAVRVAAAPWNTPMARAAYAVVILLLLGWIWRVLQSRRERELRRSRELERMVGIRTHELEDRNQQLLVLSRAKSDFVARMNHELRTPMNGVLGMSELLLDTRLEPVQKRFVESIHRSAASLLAIVDDVLDFSKIEAGRLQLAPVECDLVELVEQTAEVLAARAAAKNIELLCDCPARPMPRVRADTVRLRQVLVNLGSNAVKFTERGEVTLRVAPLGVERDSLRVRLDVVDTGIGIEPENQTRIFDEFVQEDASTTRRFGGTGLGLAIARQLVELMGGHLSLVSARGKGSTFSFELVLQLAEPAAAPPPLTDLRGLHVLVADDNDAARDVLISVLSQWGAIAVGAGSFSGLESELRAASCNVAIIDDSLLEPPALDHFRELLAERVTRPRVIRLASLTSLAHMAVSGEPWFDAYLTKPVRLLRLHDAVIGTIGQTAGAANAAEPRAQGLPKLRGRVLLVEDQSVNRDVAEGMLRALGLQVESAVDGMQALEMLAPGRFDAVLMDCQMPVMDGFTATRELRRRQGAEARVPVIALTADTTVAARDACFAMGMNDYLGKPFNRATLRSVLSRWLPVESDERVATEQYG